MKSTLKSIFWRILTKNKLFSKAIYFLIEPLYEVIEFIWNPPIREFVRLS